MRGLGKGQRVHVFVVQVFDGAQLFLPEVAELVVTLGNNFKHLADVPLLLGIVLAVGQQLEGRAVRNCLQSIGIAGESVRTRYS